MPPISLLFSLQRVNARDRDGQRHFHKRLARRLSNDFFYHISSDVGEPIVSTLMPKREFCVIESEKLKYCGVEVMHVNRVVRN